MIRLLFIFLFAINFANAQQLESLRILKSKHDSIETYLKQKYQEEIAGKPDKEISDIYYKYLGKRNLNNRERFSNYRATVKAFLDSQKRSEPDSVAPNLQIPEKAASYSPGFTSLYKEVHDFIQKKYNDELDLPFTKTARIHFWVQNDASLFIEKVEGVDPEFNEMALLAFLMTSGKWESGTQRGMKVKSKFILPIKFVVGE